MANTFTASAELCNILLNNGFSELTKKHYAKHYEQLHLKGYNPNSQKRVFSIDNRNLLKLDYISIVPYYRGSCPGSDIKNILSDLELRSIIAFYQFKSPSRARLYNINNGITNLHSYYRLIIDFPKNHKSISDNQFKSLFEAVKL